MGSAHCPLGTWRAPSVLGQVQGRADPAGGVGRECCAPVVRAARGAQKLDTKKKEDKLASLLTIIKKKEKKKRHVATIPRENELVSYKLWARDLDNSMIADSQKYISMLARDMSIPSDQSGPGGMTWCPGCSHMSKEGMKTP